MRMQLYEVEIEVAGGTSWAAIVAPSEGRAVELVHEHYQDSGEEFTEVRICRIDDSLEGEQRLGLDDMLETAPVGFASFCPPIGWLVHAAAVHRLRLFKIAEKDGPETFVIAPNPDVASAVWAASIAPLNDEPRLFRIFDGIGELTGAQREQLASMLDFGPIGIMTWHEDEGWSVQPPG